ncbi:hypothetical protein D3C77_726980 [compost metagenome]
MLDDLRPDTRRRRPKAHCGKAGLKGVTGLGLGDVEVPAGGFQGGRAFPAQRCEPFGPEAGQPSPVTVDGFSLSILFIECALQAGMIGDRR